MPFVMRTLFRIDLLLTTMEHLLPSLTRPIVPLVSGEFVHLPPPPAPSRIPPELLVCYFCDRVFDSGEGFVYGHRPICEGCTWQIAEEGGF